MKVMTNLNVMAVLNLILAVFGVYMIAAGLKMKKEGEISPVLITPEEIEGCRDKGAFIAFLYRREAAFGGMSLILGALGLVNCFTAAARWVQVAEMAAFVLAFAWFSHALRKAREAWL